MAIGFIFFLPSATAMARPQLPQELLRRLEKGEVLEFSDKVKGSSVEMAKAIAIIPDVPEAVLYVLTDLAKYKHFLPHLKDSRIVKYQGMHTYAVVETSLPWPFKDAWAYFKFTRYDKPGRIFEIKWWMINGTLQQYTGHALIEPWNKEGTKTVLTYKFLAVPKTMTPDSTITEGVKTVAASIVNRSRLRLEALRKYKKMPKGF
jgi:ribosome-associated toxin RatA of RatAB toxin-antitoxin module